MGRWRKGRRYLAAFSKILISIHTNDPSGQPRRTCEAQCAKITHVIQNTGSPMATFHMARGTFPCCSSVCQDVSF